MSLKPDLTPNYRRPESVLVVVQVPPDLTLLLKRQPPGAFWQSVTGSMEWSESCPRQTSVRELREETGITAEPSQFKNWERRFRYSIPKQLLHRYRDGVCFNVEHMFSIQLPEVVPVQIVANEHQDFQWIKIQDAIDLVWSWSNREALTIVDHWNRAFST